MRTLGDAGLRLIKNFEGCRLTAYKPVNTEVHWTIGWGHYGPDVKQGDKITQEQADAMLADDLKRYVAYVNNNNFVTIIDKLTQNQFDALVSFCYNCGPGNLQNLCKGKRTPEAIAEDLIKYNKSSSTVLPGLVKRREEELALFNKSQEVAPDEVKIIINNISVIPGKIVDGHIEGSIAAVLGALGISCTYHNDVKKLFIYYKGGE